MQTSVQDLVAVTECGRKLIGEHDFRNFCCMQIRNGVTNYVRTALDFNIQPFNKHTTDDMYNIYEITIKGSAFVYHQIRFIVAVIFMIRRQVRKG